MKVIIASVVEYLIVFNVDNINSSTYDREQENLRNERPYYMML
jgi:hypothetical protein